MAVILCGTWIVWIRLLLSICCSPAYLLDIRAAPDLKQHNRICACVRPRLSACVRYTAGSVLKINFSNEFAVDGSCGASASKPFAENSPSWHPRGCYPVLCAVKDNLITKKETLTVCSKPLLTAHHQGPGQL